MAWKTGLSFLIADEEENYVRQIDELKQNAAKKDAELSQLRADLAERKKVRNRFDNLDRLKCYFLIFSVSAIMRRFEETVAVC